MAVKVPKREILFLRLVIASGRSVSSISSFSMVSAVAAGIIDISPVSEVLLFWGEKIVLVWCFSFFVDCCRLLVMRMPPATTRHNIGMRYSQIDESLESLLSLS